MRLLINFTNHLKARELVGLMIMAYGEFEFEVAGIMSYAIDGGPDTAARIFFRVNGEAARLDVADAILRPFFDKLTLGGRWGNALGALRFCKNVRNQYAHCQWHPDAHNLYFFNLDRDGRDSLEGELIVNPYPTNLELLQKQYEYFEHTLDWLYYLSCECRGHKGEESARPPVPKSIPQPQLHIRPKKPLQSPETETNYGDSAQY